MLLTQSNEISASYYFCLVGQINRGTCGTCKLRVAKKLLINGEYSYHLISN